MTKTQLRRLANRLLREENLNRWKFKIGDTGNNLGVCDYQRSTIVLNEFYVDHNSEKDVIDTLKHEIAHALTPGHKHDKVWKSVALRLGCKPERCGKTKILTRPGAYGAVCPCCGTRFNKSRKPKYAQGYYCPSCGKEKGKLTFKKG